MGLCPLASVLMLTLPEHAHECSSPTGKMSSSPRVAVDEVVQIRNLHLEIVLSFITEHNTLHHLTLFQILLVKRSERRTFVAKTLKRVQEKEKKLTFYFKGYFQKPPRVSSEPQIHVVVINCPSRLLSWFTTGIRSTLKICPRYHVAFAKGSWIFLLEDFLQGLSAPRRRLGESLKRDKAADDLEAGWHAGW